MGDMQEDDASARKGKGKVGSYYFDHVFKGKGGSYYWSKSGFGKDKGLKGKGKGKNFYKGGKDMHSRLSWDRFYGTDRFYIYKGKGKGKTYDRSRDEWPTTDYFLINNWH